MKERFDAFARSTKQLSERLPDYEELFELALVQPSLRIYMSKLAEVYYEDGKVKAQEVIKDLTDLDSELLVANSLLSALKSYLNASLTMLEVYKSSGCTYDDVVVFGCEKVNPSNELYVGASAERESAAKVFNTSAYIVKTAFKSNTETLQEILKEDYE